MRKISWIGSGILLLLYLAFQITFHPVSSDISLVALDAFTFALTYFIFGAIAAVIVSIIPYKNWPLAKKFETVLPMAIFAVLLFYILIFGFMEYQTQVNGIKSNPVRLN
jgi:uncharacterized membrane protein